MNNEIKNMLIKPKERNSDYAPPYVSVDTLERSNEYDNYQEIKEDNLGYEISPLEQNILLERSNVKYEYTPISNIGLKPLDHNIKANTNNYDYSVDMNKQQAFINSSQQATGAFDEAYISKGISGRATSEKIRNAITEPIYKRQIVFDYYKRNKNDFY